MPLRWYNNKKSFQKNVILPFLSSNRNFGKFLKIIFQRISVTLQTDALMINYYLNIFFRNSAQKPEAAVHGCSVKGCFEKIHKNYRKTLVPDSLF